ncbi:unnamed protein product [Prunus armeniaca]
MMDIVDALQETTSIMGAKHLKLPCLLFHPKCAAGKYGNYYDFEFYTLLMTRPNTYYMRKKYLARCNCYEPVAQKFIINGLWPIYNDFNARPKCRSASNAQRVFDGEQFKIAETTCVVKMKEYWPNPTAKDLTESKFFWERQWKEHDVNVTKMLEDAGISIGMDFDPIVIIQVIEKKTKSFPNIRCYKGMLWGDRICFGKYGMFRDCNMRIVYHKISLPAMPPTIKAEPSPRLGGKKKKKGFPAEQPRPGGGVGPTSSGWPEGKSYPRSKTRGVTVALQHLLQ